MSRDSRGSAVGAPAPVDRQRQARALGDPTRHEIFHYVSEADAPVGVAELTAHLGLHHNAIRQHLAKLVAADLVDESTSPAHGRGRPRLMYRVSPAAQSRWGGTTPYERLSLMLADMVRSGSAPEEVGRRSAVRTPLVAGDNDALGVLVDEMAAHGFEPELRRRGRRIEIVLQTCPFATAAEAEPDIVCNLHLGIAQGVASRTHGRIVVDELIARDPHRAGCRLCVHEEPAARERR